MYSNMSKQELEKLSKELYDRIARDKVERELVQKAIEQKTNYPSLHDLLVDYETEVKIMRTMEGGREGSGIRPAAPYKDRAEQADKVKAARLRLLSFSPTREKIKSALEKAFKETGACIILEDFDCEIGNPNRDDLEMVVGILLEELYNEKG